MIDKITKVLSTALNSVDRLKIQGMPRKLIFVFLFVVLAVILLFIGGWLFSWYATGKPELTILNQFLQTITGGAFIAAVGFFCKGLIDRDNDGIPDDMESEENKNGKSN